VRFYGFGHSGIYIGLLSYCGALSVSVTTDPRVEPAPSRLAQFFAEAVVEIHEASQQLKGGVVRQPLSATDVAIATVLWLALALLSALLTHAMPVWE
jgi:hypothetical protein